MSFMITITSSRGRERIEIKNSNDFGIMTTAFKLSQVGTDYDTQSVEIDVSGIEGLDAFISTLTDDLLSWQEHGTSASRELKHLNRCLKFRIGKDDSMITGTGKAVLKIEYESLVLNLVFQIVVDASCATLRGRLPDS